MKTTHFYAGLVSASMLAATSVFAGPWDGHSELEQSILNDLDRPAYVGTSLAASRERVHIYGGAGGMFPNHDIDNTGYVVGAAGPEKGDGERYGSILFDVGAFR